ncbi:MAG TPA: hypothetical protein VLB67_01890 [Acidimicrobiia bacterium]|nr:hypothetical protein [Acidimicrobiia bacterium]
MLDVLAVREVEGWTAGSITAGILLLVLVIVGLAWVIERASRL